MNKNTWHASFLWVCLSAIASMYSSLVFSKEITVIDFSNHDVSLSKPATRIIALAPNIVENLFSIGAGENIIATVEYADYPKSANTIERIGNAHAISIEKIISLEPDLVIVWSTGKSEKLVSKLRDLGITVYASNPRSLNDIKKTLYDFGLLTNNSYQANNVVAQFEIELNRIRKKYSNQLRVKVMYQIWQTPIMTINKNQIIDDVITLCGGTNIFSDAVALVPKVSIESVIAKNPEVIFSGKSDTHSSTGLDHWARWPVIDAVKNGHLFYISSDTISRHTVRLLQGAKEMCEKLDSVRAHRMANKKSLFSN